MAKRLNENDASSISQSVSSSSKVTSEVVEGGTAKGSAETAPERNGLSTKSFPVVGIVASAGGLESFKSFFAALPSACGMAFVLVPHLDANRKSLMVELITRQTSLPVVEAIDGTFIEVDSIYIIPPNHALTLSQGRLRLGSLPDPIGSQTAIDAFLRSLAEDQKELAIGIILSGTGSHGTQGIRDIKRCGGMAMVQSPESAEFDQMPRSAIETGLVDFVLPPDAMPETLLRYVRQPYVNRSRPPLMLSEKQTEQLNVVLDLIRAQTKQDFRSYRPNMILRRIERRMGLDQLDELDDYIALLKKQPSEVEALCKDLLIGVTAFFRETEAFAVLEKDLFPRLVQEQSGEVPLRVWVPSCATGEEAYSIAILLLEAFATANKPANLQIFASDINQHSIQVARRGIYPASIAIDISPERLKHFFLSSGAIHYQVSKQLRDSIVFSQQNVIRDAPFSRIDLISCRNLLIYLEPDVQQKLISLFHYALVENGHLILGPAETIGRATNLFESVSKKWRVYRRISTVLSEPIALPVSRTEDSPKSKAIESQSSAPRKGYRELTETTLRDYMPAAALINQRYEVLYVSGSLVDYIEFPTGELSKDLLAMARAGLRTRLRAACHQAMSQRVAVTDNEARVQRNGTYVPCTIIARPLLDSKGIDGLTLVLFQDRIESNFAIPSKAAIPVTIKPSGVSADSHSLLQHLEYELKSTREELQNTIEEMESANEELQSSNEELESSKEELQSLNEELSTVNCQLLEKVSELDKSNSEFMNLMASTEIATLYLDDQLRIKRFTHSIVDLFSLVPADEGRDIRGFASQIMDNKLLEECQLVLKNQTRIETEIFTKDHRCFLRRILPFRKANHETEGVVVSYVDLTASKRAEAEQRERDACFREIFNHAATGIAIASLDGIIEQCNPAYCEIVGCSESELLGRHFLTLIHPDDQATNQESLRTLLDGEKIEYELENRYLHKDGSNVWVRKLGSILMDGSGKPSRLMALVTDITAQRKALDALKQSEERNRAILKTASDAIITIDNQGIIDSVNHSTEVIFGYSNSEMVGKNVSMLMPLPFSKEHDGYIQRFLNTNEPHIIGTGREVICRRKDGSNFPADLAVSQVDHLGLFTGVLRDISSRKEMQKHILDIAAEEQRRIGLELHDGTQQELTGLSLFANALQESIENAVPSVTDGQPVWQFDANPFQRLRDTAALLSRRLAETNQHVRDLAHGIVPVQIDTEGLRSALVELANSLNSNEKSICSFECEGEYSIPNNTTATHLYRIAQEAVNNALRHGLADQIKISLCLQDDRIVLEIWDNGVGFDTESSSRNGLSSQGMGMRTMEYRASLIGGRIQIRKGPEGGTLVRCETLKWGEL